METDKADILATLRREIQSLQGFSPNKGGEPLELGLESLKSHLPDGAFPLGAIHEVLSESDESAAAAVGFTMTLTGQIMQRGGGAVWICKTRTAFPPGLKAFGLDPDRIVFLEAAREKEALWAMEEALRCPSLAAVITELPDADFTATRRLQLAVEKSAVTGFLLRQNPKKAGSTACITRWQVRPLPSQLEDGLPGVGFPRWDIELLKARNGKPGRWSVEWKGNRLHELIPTKVETVTPIRRTSSLTRVGNA
jgi:protein ImuA